MERNHHRRVKAKVGDATDSSNAQSFDLNQPTDIHHRPIDYLTETEVKRLVAGAKASRNPDRDTLLILMLFRHGLRESEATMIRRDWIKLDSAQLWIQRLKGGNSSFHPISGDELRLIRKYLRTRTDDLPWLFISERMNQLSRESVREIVKNASALAGLPRVNPHKLRHSCGFYLNDKGHNSRLIQDYLGHKNPASTMIYTRTSSKRFQGLF